MNIASATFQCSSQKASQCPASSMREFAFIGRSNVGKSSLINMLTGRPGLAKVSSTPGKTRLINHFIINDEWALVDLPGYGYAKVSRRERSGFSSLITDYVLNREQLYYLFVLVDSRVKHELVGSPYNDRRASCERVARVLGQEFLRGATMEQLDAVKERISEEDYKRARYVIGEERRVLDVCDALERGDYETVGRRMYETHWGMSKDYEVSCEELDFLVEVAEACGVSGSRIMGGGFGGCTINLVKEELYDSFIATAREKFAARYGHEPKVYDVVISDGSRRLE